MGAYSRAYSLAEYGTYILYVVCLLVETPRNKENKAVYFGHTIIYLVERKISNTTCEFSATTLCTNGASIKRT